MKEEEERTPLRTILQNFLNHIEKLDKEKLEGSYDKEFQELKLFSEFLKTSKQYSCSQGEKEVNRKKNRYKDILPFDCSRVILEDYAGIPGSDYINANYIKGASGSPAYIASQGPLPHTVNDFWRMVVQCEVQVIVMACNEEESGKHKCENYWVEHEGEEKQFGMVAIQLIKASVVCPDFLVRTMRLKYTKNHSSTQEERTVCQFHYSAWPDHGVPPLVRPLLDMVRLVRDTQASETLPVLVHCSAGCGRTGTICAIDYVWGLLRAGKLTKDFSLFKLVREMRKQRIAMVQTKEQYVLVHHAVKELFNEQLRMIDSHPYENIDINGMVKESPEPVYATITCDTNNEEKQDSNEKEEVAQNCDDAPPLPCKRKPYTAHTKQEKEVENLTEKQRSSGGEQPALSDSSSPGTSSSNSSTCGSILHKPRIAKLRALFERTSGRDGKGVQGKHRSPQQVTRSHSLGAVRKVEEGVTCIQPIPNRGILRVPQLAVTSDATYVRAGRPALPIKRSKSLKVLSSGERNKFSVPAGQGGTFQESQYKDCVSAEMTELKLSSKVSCPSGDKSVVCEVKPHVPPKKITKDRVSERKITKNITVVSKPSSSQNDTHVLKKNGEDVQLGNSRLSSMDCWRRRSLDSLPLENDALPSPSNLSSAQVTSPPRKQEQYRLDEDALKLLQDCRDYLTASAKTDSSRKPAVSERNFQESLVNIDSLRHLTVEAQRKVNAVVGGLGTRERRNSFRQAISKESEANVRSHEYDPHWLNKATASTLDGIKQVGEPTVDGKGLSNPSHMRMKGLPKPTSVSSPNQALNPAVRVYRTGKPRKPEPNQGLHFVKSDASAQGRGPCPVQKDPKACVGCANVSDLVNFEARRVNHPDCIPAGISGTSVSKTVYVKGKNENSTSARPEMRLAVQNPLHFQNTTHNTHRLPGHTGPTESANDKHSEIRVLPSAAKLGGNQCVLEGHEQKAVNVSVVRRVNTGSKSKFIVPGTSCIKHHDRPNASEPEPSLLSRGAYSEVPRLSQGLIVHPEAQRAAGVVSEQISITQKAANSTGITRPAESHALLCKTHSKGEAEHNTSLKHEMSGVVNRPKEWSEKSAVSVGAVPVRPLEWAAPRMVAGTAHVSSATKQNWTSAPLSQGQEPRFRGADSEQSGGSGRSVLDREAPRTDTATVAAATAAAAAADRSTSAGRLAPKLTVKQKKESVGNEGVLSAPLHHGSQDDLALCAAGGSAGSSRVRRHASVVLLRHSLIETNEAAPLAPLAVWNAPQLEINDGNAASANRQNVSRQDLEAWNGAPGVDVDMVGASIKPSRDHGTPLTRALEAFHLRKPSRGAAVSPPQQRKFLQPQQVVVKKQHYL